MWIFVEVLNVTYRNKDRIRYMSMAVAVFVWASFLLGGYWYMTYYGDEMAIIKAGPWPWAHLFFMEAKEHLSFMFLLLGTYLPIVVNDNRPLAERGARTLTLTVIGLIVLLGLTMEGFGAVISLAVKRGLLGSD